METKQQAYNAIFMKDIYNYLSYINGNKSTILLLTEDQIHDYIKQYVYSVYLKSQYEIVSTRDGVQTPVSKEEFAKTYDSSVERVERVVLQNMLKVKGVKELKQEVSNYMVSEIVKKIVLQYDKRDIIQELENDTSIMTEEHNNKPENKDMKKTYVSNIKFELDNIDFTFNQLKNKYFNTLSIIIKNVCNRIAKNLQEEKSDQFTYTLVDKKKTLKIKSRTSFVNYINTKVDEAIKEINETVIDTKDNTQQFIITKNTFTKLSTLYTQIKNYKCINETPVYNLGSLMQAVNKKTKVDTKVAGLSIPVTYYYIKEYLPTILMEIVNRIMFLNEKKPNPVKLFRIDDVIMTPELFKSINIEIVKRHVYYQKKAAPQKKKSKE